MPKFIDSFRNWLEIFWANKITFCIIANIAGNTIEDYCEVAKRLSEVDKIKAFELNISCPNVKHGGMAFGIKSNVAYDVVKEIRALTTKPLMVKLSPNAEDIVDMAVKCWCI